MSSQHQEPRKKKKKRSEKPVSDVTNPADERSKASTQTAQAIEKNIVDLVDLVAKMEKTDGEKTKAKVNLCSQQNRNAKLDELQSLQNLLKTATGRFRLKYRRRLDKLHSELFPDDDEDDNDTSDECGLSHLLH